MPGSTFHTYQASQALLRVAGDLDLLGSPVAVTLPSYHPSA